MKRLTLMLFMAFLFCQTVFAQDKITGVRGDSAAIADAVAMVETMGGIDAWASIKSLHFVHRWFPWYMPQPYIENEILDLTGPRSWVEMKSDIYYHLRAYSPEDKYWSVEKGEFSFANEERLKNALDRAPFSIYRIARAIAIGDPFYEVRFGEGDVPGTQRLEFYGPEGDLGGWIILNVLKEPIVWATTQYRYAFGPLKKFGDILVPNWAVYENGITVYEMVSLTASDQAPDSTLFSPPPEYIETDK